MYQNEKGIADYPPEEKTSVKQCLKYAEDLSEIYEQEKARRKALEEANTRLALAIAARKRAEKALMGMKRELEKKVRQRIEELSVVNEKLKFEVSRHKSVEERLRAELKEEEALLNEIHHEGKNGL